MNFETPKMLQTSIDTSPFPIYILSLLPPSP